MRNYLTKKYFLISLILIATFFLFISIDLTSISIPYLNSQPIICLLIIGSWIYALYHTIIPTINWLKFKKEIIRREVDYKPNPIDFKHRKDLFNIKINSNNTSLDIIEQDNFKATFYRDKHIVKIWRKDKEINFSDIKSLVVKFDLYHDHLQLSEYSLVKIHIAKFYILLNDNSLFKLFYFDCKFDQLIERDKEHALHKKEDFLRIFTDNTMLLSDLSTLPIIIYKD
jgi:hypothetical protein